MIKTCPRYVIHIICIFFYSEKNIKILIKKINFLQCTQELEVLTRIQQGPLFNKNDEKCPICCK